MNRRQQLCNQCERERGRCVYTEREKKWQKGGRQTEMTCGEERLIRN